MYLAGRATRAHPDARGAQVHTDHEIYIKRLLATISTVAPNTVKMGGGAGDPTYQTRLQLECLFE
jgi:hypothetical protein